MAYPALRFSRIAAFAGAAVLAGSASAAYAITDPIGDILPTFAGGPNVPDLDVVSATATLEGAILTLSATMNGAIGTTPGGVYVWGVDRGAGQALFQTSAPQIGAGVLFDSVVVFNTNETGAVVLILPTAGAPTPLPAGSVDVSGNTITGVLNISMLPSNGFAPQDYGYNLWPRNGIGGSNTQVSDFAPDASTFKATFVPEPATWSLMIVGFGVAGAMMRRRRTAFA